MIAYRITALYQNRRNVDFVIRAANEDQARSKAAHVAPSAVAFLIKA